MKEITLRIKTFGDPVLRKKSISVKNVDSVHKQILSKMARLMYDSGGIGLAAPQVGINEAMIVVDIGNSLYKLINPKIAKKSGNQVLEEGCLSVPGVCIKVKRAKEVLVQALDDSGKQVNIEAQGLLACVFQHEIDHLHGKLIVDYASFLDKLKIKNKLKKLREKAKIEKLPESENKSCELQL
ncbi:MAG: peptide deformylase [Candidatus Omnitrophica bacterium]|nr:peptide deformylase [Candidatus Omnitrophota bacterium]